MCPLLPALQNAPFPLQCPASLGDALSRKMDYSVEPRQIFFDHASVRVPANVLARTWRARQAVDPVPSRLQLRDQSRPDKPLRPAHENFHAPPPYASVSCAHMVTFPALRNRMSYPKYPPAPTKHPTNADVPQSITSGTVEVRSARPAFVRYLLVDRIYLTNLPFLVLPSIQMVYGCISDGAPA